MAYDEVGETAPQRTLVIIKPDGVRKGVVNEILQRYQDAGLQIVLRHNEQLSEPLIEELYKEHRGKFFFEGLVLSMMSGPCAYALLTGPEAIATARKLSGATDPSKAEPGTIRHDFRSAGGPFNTVHSSDSLESADREIKLLFNC